MKVELSFLPPGRYDALLARDTLDEAGAIDVERRSFNKGDTFEVVMRPGGGFVARFIANTGT